MAAGRVRAAVTLFFTLAFHDRVDEAEEAVRVEGGEPEQGSE